MNELIQWMWQGVVLVTVVSLSLWRMRLISASMRCRIWWATLALVAALPFLGALDLPGMGAVLGIDGPAQALSEPAAVSRPADVTSAISWLPILLLGAWTLVSGARFYLALAQLEMAKRACRPFPVARERQMPRWKAVRNRGRRATLVVSEHVRVAGVLGLGYPRIAVAPDMVSSLTDEELDQLVLHEYGHVQRRDDIATAVQLLVRTIIGWHPAVWWIDRRLHVEREVACDDWVLAATDAPRIYARCLTRIADLASGLDSVLVPAACRQRQLTTRVLRLLDGRRNTSIRPSAFALATATVLLCLVSIGLAGRHTTAVPLPAVARAAVGPPTIDTPELALATVLQSLSGSTGRRTQTMARATYAVDSSPTDEQGDRADAVHAAAEPSSAAYSSPFDVMAASTAQEAESPVSPPTNETHVAVADAPPSSAPSGDTVSVASAALVVDAEGTEDSGSWVGASGRALVEAGKTTGQSIAGAGVDAGQAIADAGVAAFKGGQKTAVKAGRFFSRLGRTLTRPF